MSSRDFPARASSELVQELVGELHVQKSQVGDAHRAAPWKPGSPLEAEVVDDGPDLLDGKIGLHHPSVRKNAPGQRAANAEPAPPVQRKHGAHPKEVAILLDLLAKDLAEGPARPYLLPALDESNRAHGPEVRVISRHGMEQARRFVAKQRAAAGCLFTQPTGKPLLPCAQLAQQVLAPSLAVTQVYEGEPETRGPLQLLDNACRGGAQLQSQEGVPLDDFFELLEHGLVGSVHDRSRSDTVRPALQFIDANLGAGR